MPAAEHTHSPTPEEIMEYVDGEGTAASRKAIGAHLVWCDACQAIAAEQRGMSEHAQAWTVGAAPASLQPPASRPARVLLPVFGAWRPSRFVLGVLSAAAVIFLAVFTRETPRLARPEAAAVADDSRVDVSKRARSAGRGGVVAGQAGDVAARPDSSVALTIPLAGMASAAQGAEALRAPMVIRTATLRIVAKEFGGVRAAVEGIVSQAGGFVDQMTITGDKTTARELRGTVRVPGDQMTASLARLRQVGQVVEDTQGAQDVTDHIVDLDARLASARAAEQRLKELLQTRTGKLSDVLEVERELTRVRLDIERLDAEKTNVGRRVSYATIHVTVSEERKAGLEAGPLPITSRIRIAATDGLASALESVALMTLMLLRVGPALLLWAVVVGTGWLLVRRFRLKAETTGS